MSNIATATILNKNNILDFPTSQIQPTLSVINQSILKKRSNPKNYNKNHESQEVYPFKSINDINKMKAYFLSTGYNNEKYRNYLLFTLGINVGLRCGDILNLKWENIFEYLNNINSCDLMVYEQKTNKKREITFNDSVIDAINLYLQNTDSSLHTGYIFKSQRHSHITVRSVNTLLKQAATSVGIKFNVGTHSMRKTFGYHQLLAHRNDAMFLSELCDMFGHSSPKITLRYCGIQSDNFRKYYKEVCL